MDEESRAERRGRCGTLALLFQEQGVTPEVMAILRSRAQMSERYQLTSTETARKEILLARLERDRLLERRRVQH